MSDSPRTRNTSQAAPRASDAEWQAKRLEVLERLDIAAEYTELGVTPMNRSPRGGWLDCYAIDAPNESTPGSAAIKVSGENLGLYNDLGHSRLKMGLFDFAAKYGKHATWFDALKHYAAKTGVVLPSGGSAGRQPSRPLAPPRPKKKDKPKRCEDIGPTLLAYHRRAAASGELDALAARLRVHRDGLDAIAASVIRPGDDREFTLDSAGHCSLHPESRLIGGRITMVSADRRGKGKVKKALNDRVRGIYVPLGWVQRVRKTGYLFVAEGGSDIAALTSMGLGALGVPSAKGNIPELVAIVAHAKAQGMLPADMRVVCMVDNDEGGAGAEGMAFTAQELADALKRPIYRRRAPYAIRNGEVRSWGPKDSRDYMGAMLDNPHLEPADVRHAVGRQFADHTFHGTNDNGAYTDWDFQVTHPAQDATPPEVADEKSDGRALQVFLIHPTSTVTDGASPDPTNRLGVRAPDEKSPEVATAPAVASEPADSDLLYDYWPNPLADLPSLRPCLINANREFECRNRADSDKGMGLRLRCRKWGCEGCRTYLMYHWAVHLQSVFTLPPKGLWKLVGPMPLPRYYWTGWQKSCDRITKYIGRHDGQFVRFLQPGGKALIIGTIKFPRSKPLAAPITFSATAMAVAALLAVKPPVPAVARFAPVTTSTGWDQPPTPKTGEWKFTGWTNARTDSHAVWRTLGVAVEEAKPVRDPQRSDRRYPAHWTETECIWADTWAMSCTVPPGYVPGTPPPDPVDLFDAVLGLADPAPWDGSVFDVP